jgi:glucokinase
MTLDAGGTNLAFSALQGNRPVIPNFSLPSNADGLDRSLANLVEGFARVRSLLPAAPVAISFGLPASSCPPSSRR